jgi:hypothetical protein
MNTGQPTPPFLIIVTIVTIGTLLIGSNYFVNVEGAVWSDYDSMKKLVQAIQDGKVNDNNINWPKFRASDIYQNAGNNTQKCLNLAHKVGDNIADNEIVHCSKNNKYFKQKYSIANKTNSTNVNGVNSTNNTTSADTNVTGSISDTNGTSSYNATSAGVVVSSFNTNATSTDTNAAVSSFNTNATSTDTNAAVSSFNTNATSTDTNAAVSSFNTNATSVVNATSADLFSRP